VKYTREGKRFIGQALDLLPLFQKVFGANTFAPGDILSNEKMQIVTM
jgi:hypothetical protein